MNMKNFFIAGDCVMPLPIGVPIRLEYGNKGLLTKVSIIDTYEMNSKTACISEDSKLYDTFVRHKTVPLDILIKAGHSTVYGILKLEKSVSEIAELLRGCIGMLPAAITPSLIKQYYDNHSDFQFYAVSIESDEAKFQTVVSVKQWLSSVGFKVIKSFLVPAEMNDLQFEHIIHSNNLETSCTYPVICGFVTYNKSSVKYYDTEMNISIVDTEPKLTFNDQGHVETEFAIKELNELFQIPYSESEKYNIHKKSIIITSNNKEIVFTSNSKKTYPKLLNCPLCNSKIIVSHDLKHPTKCANPHCVSNVYLDTVWMCKVLNLPMISKSDFYVWGKNINNLVPATFLNDHFSAEFTFHASLENLVRAAIPKRILPTDQAIIYLISVCNDSIETLIYYLRNSDRILVDLGLDNNIYRRFLTWIKAHDNDVITLITSPHVLIDKEKKVITADPILRGDRILLTGQFKRGSENTIIEILESCAAQVVHTVDDCNIVLTGSLMEGTNGFLIREARSKQKTIIDEDTFFTSYQIDNDIKSV